REAPARILAPRQGASTERHDERQRLGKRQQSALPELRVDQVIVAARHAATNLEPGLDVIPGPAGALEVEDVDVHPGRPQELRLTLDEERGARETVGHRPLAGDHQDPERGSGGHQGCPSTAGLALRASPIRQKTTCRKSARAAPPAALRGLPPPRTPRHTPPSVA